ncbi:unnamed protein product [Euphydryas editha]|uniref:Endonuclease-reverse transcriptase n=1 Tax=Euphydryas editha TaxID=104508 RepID=A0AAU9USL2_EUPED|nr:unnamed protein product [Euphydryas editha]
MINSYKRTISLEHKPLQYVEIYIIYLGKHITLDSNSNELEVERRTKKQTVDALHHAQRLKFKWAGHVARLKDKRWTSKVTTWDGPQGKRRVGRPYTRWEDDIKKVAGPHWIHIAKDREKWKSLEEAFT